MAIGSNDFLCSKPSKAAIKAPRSSKIDKSEIKKSSTLGFTLSWKKERQFLTLLFTPWKIVTDFFQLKIIVPNEVKQCLCFLRNYEKMKDNKKSRCDQSPLFEKATLITPWFVYLYFSSKRLIQAPSAIPASSNKKEAT